MKKEIELVNPPITSYSTIANLMSLLWGHREKTMPWICDNFIQLYSTPVNESLIIRKAYFEQEWANFYDFVGTDNYLLTEQCPFVNTCKMDRRSLQIDVFTDFLERQIDTGYYVEVLLDNYYISSSESFKSEHYTHQTLLYGYDNEAKTVFAADFYNHGKFVFTTISYNEVDEAYRACVFDKNTPMWKTHIFSNRYVDYDYIPNLALMRTSLQDYLEGKDSFNKYFRSFDHRNMEIFFGLEYYDRLLRHCEEQKHLDRRAFHVLYDRKIIMKLRVEYLLLKNIIHSTNYDILEQADSLANISLVVRNLVIKSQLCPEKGKAKLLTEIKLKLELMKEKDRVFVERLVSLIS